MNEPHPTPGADLQSDRAFLGHPRGLGYLAFTELWERFSYYGMQTLLVLYMTRQLLLPGHVEHVAGFAHFRQVMEQVYGAHSTVALASAIFGTYAACVYLTPILGGFIADQWLGRTRTITLGALLMVAGHFLMAFETSFLVALLCLLFGVGFFKGNLASQVGALYAPGDLRRADAFQIYYLAINAAVIVAPIVTGWLGEKVAWHYGFGAAGVGMVLGLIIYRSGKAWLPPEPTRAQAASTPRAKLSGDEWKTILLLAALVPVLALGTVGNNQIFNAYMLWVPDHVGMTFFGWTMPTTWLIALDAGVSTACLLGSVLFWRWWAQRFPEPSEINKMTIGLALSVLAMGCLAMAAIRFTPDHKASFAWVLGFELLNSIGFSNLLPVGLALYARASPKAIVGTMIGIYMLHLFLCNFLVGKLGGMIEHMSGVNFWLMHAGLIGAACVVLFLAARLTGHLLNPTGPAENPAV